MPRKPSPSALAAPKVKKPRRRPCVKGHPGVERGSPAASDLYWIEVAKVMEAGGVTLPNHTPFGFVQSPSPASDTAHATFEAWHRHVREWHHQTSLTMTPEDRATIYWMAVDHRAMFGGRAADPYVFGYTEHPAVRPPEHPEPDYVREFRELREKHGTGVAHSSTIVTDALATLGLALGATKAEIVKAFRKRVLETHPDRGGSDAAFNAVVAAKEAALAHLEKS